METTVPVDEHYRLWVEVRGHERATPLLLIMGANTSGVVWPDRFVDELAEHYRVIRYDHRDTGRSTWGFAEHYRVIRYDHRDTGRSTWGFAEHPYAIRDLATDAVAVLDALEVDSAHVVGMSMGGVLVQLLLLDQPHRLRSATIFGTAALGKQLAGTSEDTLPELPGVDPRLLALWEEVFDEREYAEELEWRVDHWRVLNGDALVFDADWFRALEQRVMTHSGTHRSAYAHARADQSGLDRGGELAGTTVPTLVVDAPADPVAPPPHGAYLASLLGRPSRTEIAGMGHALSPPVLEPLSAAIRAHVEDAENTPEAG